MKKQLFIAIFLASGAQFLNAIDPSTFGAAPTPPGFGAAPAAPGASVADIKQWDKLSAYDIYRRIDAAKIASFSTDSFKRSKADQNYLNNITVWNKLTDSLNQYAAQNASAADKSLVAKYIQDLTNTRAYIEGTIDALRSNSVRTSAADAQKYALNMSIIEHGALQKLKDQASAAWFKGKPTSNFLKDSNLKAFNDYKNIAAQAKKSSKPLQDFEISGLLKLYNISGKQVDALVDLLEQQAYLAKDPQAQPFADDLSRITNTLSSLTLNAVATTKDKTNVILFAQAGAYENILRQIIKELGQ